MEQTIDYHRLHKIDYNTIEWERKGHLYRADSEGKFALRTLTAIVKEGKEEYCGYIDANFGQKLTFCEPTVLHAAIHAKGTLEKPGGRNYDVKRMGLSDFPIIMDMDIRLYRNSLYESPHGEGIIIDTPIDLDDIKIIYAPHINLMPKNIDFSLEEIAKSLGIEKEDLLGRYAKNPKRTKKDIGFLAFGYAFNNSEEQNKKIQEFLSILRDKMR